jgi:hypothetical protein
MFDSDKPLFSRPVLSAVMLFCTLAIWLLTLTAPSSKLPIPIVETWTTTSGIPVIWLKQEQWKDSTKLEIRLSFRSDTINPPLAQTTLAMLMSDSLPLSTASINQRLTPLAAKASSHYDHENQTIGLTLSNEPRYLVPTLSLVNHWLNAPDFKRRTFDHWQRQHKKTPPLQQQLEQALFSDQDTSVDQSNQHSITLEQVPAYYQGLKSAAVSITIIGDMSPEAKQTVQNAINSISYDYQLSSASSKTHEFNVSHAVSQHKIGTLWQSGSAVALTPITTIKEWISLQLWGTDLVSTLNQQPDIGFVQLALTLSSNQPWARWNIQYADAPSIASTEKQPSKVDAKHFIYSEQIPSATDKEAFDTLFDTFKAQLEQQALSPIWWSHIATQVTHEDGQLTLAQFASGYKDAIDSYTIEDYQASLKQLLKPSSYQEIQVYQ